MYVKTMFVCLFDAICCPPRVSAKSVNFHRFASDYELRRMSNKLNQASRACRLLRFFPFFFLVEPNSTVPIVVGLVFTQFVVILLR